MIAQMDINFDELYTVQEAAKELRLAASTVASMVSRGTLETVETRFGKLITIKPGELIRINDNITIKIVSVGPGRVKIAIDAPSNVTILREELCDGKSDRVLSAVPVDGVATV